MTDDRTLLEGLTREQRLKVLEMVATQDLLDELCERDPAQIDGAHEDALCLDFGRQLAAVAGPGDEQRPWGGTVGAGQ